MTKDYLDYGKLVDEAMYYVVRKALRLVQEYGLPADHHFFITFETEHPGVMISDELKNRYPEEMTIVIQHQFWDLEVEEESFSLVLSFDGVKQNLTVPFEALISFADPGVKFGLQFHHENLDVLPEDEPDLMLGSNNTTSGKKSGKKGKAGKNKEGGVDNVVTLDSFRKK